MTAPVFIASAATLLPSGALSDAGPGTLLTLTGAEARHAVTVRRLRAGERVDLVDGAGLRLVCEVTEAGTGEVKDGLGVAVVERVEEPPVPVRLVLVQALAKGGRDEQSVETATEVGVETVLPWQAARCVSVWSGAKRAKGRERWAATAREAAKQARRAVVPEVEAVRHTRELTAWVRGVTEAGGVVALLHEEATTPVGDLGLPAAPDGGGSGARGAGPVGGPAARPVLAVVVGPEGGIGQEETAELEAAGARTVRLGPHVMRTASAGPVALAVLAQRAGLWG